MGRNERGRLEEPLKNILGTRGMQPDQCKAYLRVTARGTRGSYTATGRCHRLRAALWGSEIPHLGPAVSGDRWKWLGGGPARSKPAAVPISTCGLTESREDEGEQMWLLMVPEVASGL